MIARSLIVQWPDPRRCLPKHSRAHTDVQTCARAAAPLPPPRMQAGVLLHHLAPRQRGPVPAGALITAMVPQACVRVRAPATARPRAGGGWGTGRSRRPCLSGRAVDYRTHVTCHETRGYSFRTRAPCILHCCRAPLTSPRHAALARCPRARRGAGRRRRRWGGVRSQAKERCRGEAARQLAPGCVWPLISDQLSVIHPLTKCTGPQPSPDPWLQRACGQPCGLLSLWPQAQPLVAAAAVLCDD